jgi:hypothetical protein
VKLNFPLLIKIDVHVTIFKNITDLYPHHITTTNKNLFVIQQAIALIGARQDDDAT